MSAENTGGNLGGNSTPTVTTVVNVVGTRNTTVTSSEHGKTVTVPVSNNAPVVPPRNPPPTQNSLPMLLQLLSQASRNTPPVTAITSRSPLVPVNTPVKPTLSFNVKIFNPLKKKDFETCVLRGVTKEAILTPTLMRTELRKQFGASLISADPDCSIEYLKGGSKLTICSSADIDEVWKRGINGESVTLWCYAPKQNEHSSDSDDPLPQKKKRKKLSALEEKNKRVESVISQLRERHGTRFTNIQYRLWGEMVDVGTHK